MIAEILLGLMTVLFIIAISYIAFSSYSSGYRNGSKEGVEFYKKLCIDYKKKTGKLLFEEE